MGGRSVHVREGRPQGKSMKGTYGKTLAALAAAGLVWASAAPAQQSANFLMNPVESYVALCNTSGIILGVPRVFLNGVIGVHFDNSPSPVGGMQITTLDLRGIQEPPPDEPPFLYDPTIENFAFGPGTFPSPSTGTVTALAGDTGDSVSVNLYFQLSGTANLDLNGDGLIDIIPFDSPIPSSPEADPPVMKGTIASDSGADCDLNGTCVLGPGGPAPTLLQLRDDCELAVGPPSDLDLFCDSATELCFQATWGPEGGTNLSLLAKVALTGRNLNVSPGQDGVAGDAVLMLRDVAGLGAAPAPLQALDDVGCVINPVTEIPEASGPGIDLGDAATVLGTSVGGVTACDS